MKHVKVDWNGNPWEGFDGRMFLTEEEWRTYRRRPPVRFTRRTNPVSKSATCQVCHSDLSDDSLQIAHRIPFIRGVSDLGLTPTFLDSAPNLVIAHKVKCNKKVELDLIESLRLLKQLGVKELPKYLRPDVQSLWQSVLAESHGP